MVSNIVTFKKGKVTTIKNEKKPNKDFTFDYSFWSHDGYTTEGNDLKKPIPGSNYVD